MAHRNTALYRIAVQIHELLDIPLNHHGDPTDGYKIINAIKESMGKALRRGESIYIRGFGKFTVVEPKGIRGSGSNFARQSGERYAGALQHMPKRYVKFQPSEQLLAMLNLGTTFDEKRAMSIWDKE